MSVSVEQAARGEDHGAAKLTWDVVRAIRAKFKARCKMNGVLALAAEYNVNRVTIVRVLQCITWVEPGATPYTPEPRKRRIKQDPNKIREIATAEQVQFIRENKTTPTHTMARMMHLEPTTVARIKYQSKM